MHPFSRETIIDRRSSALRWSAVVAGAAIAVGTWILLQLFGTGISYATADAADLHAGHQPGGGHAVWSVLSAILALGAGGYVAARLAAHHDRIVAGSHAVIAWALAAVAGVLVIAAVAKVRHEFPHAEAAPPGGYRMIQNALEPINAQLRLEAKPQLTAEEVIEAARASADPSGFDQNHFVTILDQRSALTRPEVEQLARRIDPQLVTVAYRVGEHRRATERQFDHIGCGMIVTSIALLLGLLAAVGGALLATRQMIRRRGWDADEVPAQRTHTTAPYPVPRAPSDYDEPPRR